MKAKVSEHSLHHLELQPALQNTTTSGSDIARHRELLSTPL